MINLCTRKIIFDFQCHVASFKHIETCAGVRIDVLAIHSDEDWDAVAHTEKWRDACVLNRWRVFDLITYWRRRKLLLLKVWSYVNRCNMSWVACEKEGEDSTNTRLKHVVRCMHVFFITWTHLCKQHAMQPPTNYNWSMNHTSRETTLHTNHTHVINLCLTCRSWVDT